MSDREEMTLERLTKKKSSGSNRDRSNELAVGLAIAIATIEQRAQVHADRVALDAAALFKGRVTELEASGGGTERLLGRTEAELEHAKRRIAELEAQIGKSAPSGALLGDLLKVGGHIVGLLATQQLQEDAGQAVQRIYAAHGPDGVTAYLEAVAVASSRVLQAEVTSG